MCFFSLVTVFMLSLFLGYSLVWRVTPALHSPLMSVTNAVSSIIILGAFMALAFVPFGERGVAFFLLLGAVFCCAINIAGGFFITHRMLGMFRVSQKKRK